MYVQEVQAEGPTIEMNSKLTMLKESLDETKYKTDEENFTKQSYMHMIDRMKKDFIASKIASSDHEKSLKNKMSEKILSSLTAQRPQERNWAKFVGTSP